MIFTRGKLHNPVTGSGGFCIGKVAAGRLEVEVGDSIATLVSLSLTPLRIDKILDVKMDQDQVDIVGQAVLFERMVFCPLSHDLPREFALAVLDVAVAPTQTARRLRTGDTVLIIGAGGKSGKLCAYEARKRGGVTGTVIGTGHQDKRTRRLEDLVYCDRVIQVDATAPPALETVVSEATGGRHGR